MAAARADRVPVATRMDHLTHVDRAIFNAVDDPKVLHSDLPMLDRRDAHHDAPGTRERRDGPA
jgi:hypothetical protein